MDIDRRSDAEAVLREHGFRDIFTGPYTHHVAGNPYVTLTSNGIKREGEPIGQLYETEDEAWDAFLVQFSAHAVTAVTDEHTQFAWRRYPAVDPMDGKFYASARFAFLP